MENISTLWFDGACCGNWGARPGLGVGGRYTSYVPTLLRCCEGEGVERRTREPASQPDPDPDVAGGASERAALAAVGMGAIACGLQVHPPRATRPLCARIHQRRDRLRDRRQDVGRRRP